MSLYIPNKIYNKNRNGAKEGCTQASNSYSSYDSVSAMLSNLGWRSLEYGRYDSRLAMFYKIQYGLVAVPMPSYFERPIRITADCSFVLLEVTCSPRGLAVHMQIFGT